MALNQPLNGPLPRADWNTFTIRLWGIPAGGKEGYFSALNAEVTVFKIDNHIITTYEHLLNLIDVLKNARNERRDPLPGQASLIDLVRNGFQGVHGIQGINDNDRIRNSIELAIRLWIMVGLGTAGRSPDPGVPPHPWGPDDSINGVLTRTFPQAPPSETYDVNINNGLFRGTIIRRNDPPEPDYDHEFSDLFNLWDMKRLVGFDIQWTNNILDHLLVQKYKSRRFRTTVYIFHQASILQDLAQGNPLSRIVIAEETLRTLGLLIPCNHIDCTHWFMRQVLNLQNNDLPTIDRTAARQPSPSRRVCDYSYWRPRLLILKEEFENGQPRTPFHWFRDRRKLREWTTLLVAVLAFIIALLALLAGLVSAVAGILSVHEAKLANVFASNASISAIRSLPASNNGISCAGTGPGCCAAVCYFANTTDNNIVPSIPLTTNISTTITRLTSLVLTTTTTTTVVVLVTSATTETCSEI